MAYVPEFPYKGDQAIITSGRVLFNAKDDSVLFFAAKSIGFSTAGSIHFNSDDVCIINSPKIYLGLNATEPLVKGNQLTSYLQDLNESLATVANAMKGMTGLPAGSPMLAANMAGADLSKTVQSLSAKLTSLLSKQNFTL